MITITNTIIVTIITITIITITIITIVIITSSPESAHVQLYSVGSEQ